MVLVVIGILMLLGGGAGYIYSNGNLNDGDFWWDHYGSRTYNEMVNLRDTSVMIIVVGVVLVVIGLILYASKKNRAASRYYADPWQGTNPQWQTPGAGFPNGGPDEALLQQAFLFLKERDFQKADVYFDRALDMNPVNAQAYLGKLLVRLGVQSTNDLLNCTQPFDNTEEYRRVIRFADSRLRAELEWYNAQIRERNSGPQMEGLYLKYVEAMNHARTQQDFLAAANGFHSISGYKDAGVLEARCLEIAGTMRA